MMVDDVDPSSPEVLLTFYRRLYPFKSIFHWLNHEPTPTRRFAHREFAFTLPADVYLRYNSFNSADDLKKQVCQLNPTRFEIGPVYSSRPRDRKTVNPSKFVPVQRELVFDIDMTDYDPIRTCCSGADICRRCWGFIAAAVHILDGGIRDQFGFEKLLWVYSGRRGIHLWISDAEAMDLSDDQRKALVECMSVHLGGEKGSKRLNIRIGPGKTLPPPLKHASVVLRHVFTTLILRDQECFRSEAGYEALLRLIPDSKIQDALRNQWSSDRTSEEKWEDFKMQVASIKPVSRRTILLNAMEDIVLQYTYPRLDAEVSKHRNHLLKAPFCVHPKTGRVCVPVDPAKIDEFDPEAVPTVGQLLKELDTIGKSEESAGEHHSDWEKTSLKPYVDMLNQHALGLMNETKKLKRETDLSW